MTEISILRAIESTNAVNRVLGEAIGEALQKFDQLSQLIKDMTDRFGAQSLQLKDVQRGVGAHAMLLEQYRSDLEQSSRSTREEISKLRKSVDHISLNGCSRTCPPTDPAPPSEEKTDPAIPSIHPQHLSAVR